MKVNFNKLAGALAAAVLAIALVVPLSAEAGEIPESDDPIRFILNDWTAQQATAHAAGEILNRLGYNVEYVVASYASMFEALQSGELTVAMEVYVFAAPEPTERALASGKVEMIGVNGVVPREGVAYPAYMDERCPGLPNWEALLNCAELFATPETMPKGRVIDYPADWANPYATYHFGGYGLDEQYTLIKGGSEGTMVAEIKSAIARKQPILVVFWQPHWIWDAPEITAAGGLKHIEFTPAYTEECSEDPTLGPFSDRVWDCDWPLDPPTKMIWKGAKDKWPVAYAFLKEFQITNAFFARMTKVIDQDGGDLEETTKAWVDENEAIWRPWVDAALAGS